jgi:hypothetical protein
MYQDGADDLPYSTYLTARTCRSVSNGTIGPLRFGITGSLPILQSLITMSRTHLRA